MPPKKKSGGSKKKKSNKAAKVVVIPIDDKLPALSNSKIDTIAMTIVNSDANTLSRLVTHYNHSEALKCVDINGSTPLHIAIKIQNSKMVEQLLSYNKIELNARELPVVGGNSALHIACQGNMPHLVQLLLQAGADPNLRSDSTNGETSLQICCRTNNLECARLLLKYGANPEVKDNFGNNASFWARQSGHESLARTLNLPPVKTPSAQDFLSFIMQRIPNFTLPTVKVKEKEGDNGKKGGNKKK
jgi:ankyrin repeat protein